jgi:hypothetical protein
MAASDRVRQILSDVRKLNDAEKAELFAEDAATGRAWGEEVDRRAARVLAVEANGLDRDELRSLFAIPPAEARTRLAALLDPRK